MSTTPSSSDSSGSASSGCPYPATPDMTGIGILLSFLITAVLTILLTMVLIVIRFQSSCIDRHHEHQKNEDSKSAGFIRSAAPHVLLALSTQQIVTGLSIAVSACVKIPFLQSLVEQGYTGDPHIDVLADLSSHAATIGVASLILTYKLVEESGTSGMKKTATGIRLFSCFAVCVMAFLFDMWTCHVEARWKASLVCFGLTGVLIVLAGFATYYKYPRLRTVLLSSVLINCFIFSIYYLVDGMIVKFVKRDGCNLMSAAENEWSFGQIVAMVILLGTLLSILDGCVDASESVHRTIALPGEQQTIAYQGIAGEHKIDDMGAAKGPEVHVASVSDTTQDAEPCDGEVIDLSARKQ